MFDLYSVEQAEDAIVPTIVLSSTPPEQLVFRLYNVDTLRQPAHTILFDFFGRNFLQSFFLPGFPLLAPQRLLLRLCGVVFARSHCHRPATTSGRFLQSRTPSPPQLLRLRLSGFCSKTHSHRPATSGRLIRGRTPLLHRRDFSSTFRVLFENSLHHYQQADPFFEFEHLFPTAGDFFFHFPGFVQGPASLLAPQRLLLPLPGVCSQPHSHHHYHQQQVDDFFGVEHLFPPASDFFFHFLRFARKLRPSPATRTAKHPPRWLSTTLPSRRPPSPGLMISTPSIFPRTLARKVTKTSPSLLVKTRQPRRRPRER